MHCDTTLHDYFSTTDHYCPLCSKQLNEYVKQDTESCSETHNILNKRGALVCGNCGQVEGYKIVNEYLIFHENLHKIKKKSVYLRKYHIENTLADICCKNIIDLLPINKQKIFQIFEIIPHVNKERKRMINVKFVWKQLFKMLKLPHYVIPISKSKKTIKYNKKYWDDIMFWKCDPIQSIIRTIVQFRVKNYR